MERNKLRWMYKFKGRLQHIDNKKGGDRELDEKKIHKKPCSNDLYPKKERSKVRWDWQIWNKSIQFNSKWRLLFTIVNVTSCFFPSCLSQCRRWVMLGTEQWNKELEWWSHPPSALIKLCVCVCLRNKCSIYKLMSSLNLIHISSPPWIHFSVSRLLFSHSIIHALAHNFYSCIKLTWINVVEVHSFDEMNCVRLNNRKSSVLLTYVCAYLYNNCTMHTCVWCTMYMCKKWYINIAKV